LFRRSFGFGWLALVVLVAACSSSKPAAQSTGAAFEPRSASFSVEGRQITLANGVYETEAAPGSASKSTTRYVGNDSTGDLNGDGLQDAAFVVSQSTGGSGTFFYVVAEIRAKDGFQGTNAVLLGDRIAPQKTEIRAGELIVDYADRKPGEPMVAVPSVAISKHLKVTDGKLAER
jgi:hypothetical protein